MVLQRQVIRPDGEVHREGDDMLETMYATQLEFWKRMHPRGCVNEAELVKTARNIMMEGAELMDQLNWKDWKSTRHEVDWEQAKYEVADLVAFVLNAAIECGLEPKDLFQYYMRKARVNVKRQEENY